MKKHFLQIQLVFLPTILVCVAYCTGQAQPEITKDSHSHSLTQQKTITGAQPKLFKTQGSNQSDNIHCALQDKAGNMWFGTTGEGVYCYDRKSFTQFTKKDGLSSNAVWSILEDKTGNIWFGTSEGICLYNPSASPWENEKNIIPVSISKNFILNNSNNNYYTEFSTKNTVWSMLQDKTGKIWFGTGDGVYWYDPSSQPSTGTKSFKHFLENDHVINEDSLHLKMVDCILEDRKGNIWFASGMPPGMEGVCRYDGKAITSYKPNGDSWIRYIAEDKKGTIWFGGRSHGNFYYDGKTFISFTAKTGIGNCILADKSGNVWFTGEEKSNSIESKDGIWRYDGKNFTNFSMKDGLGKYFVHCMIEDKDGNIWIGTRNTGLYKYDGETFTDFSDRIIF